MSKNLIKAGYQVTVYNRSSHAAEELESLGARRARNPSEVAKYSDVIIVIVPDSSDVRDVTLGPFGIIQSARSGLVVIDMSTISANMEKEISLAFEQRGTSYLDAPVSGGTEGAANGTLVIMVGGKEETVNQCMPIFEALGKKTTYVGPIGSGQVVKACSQLIAALSFLGVAEALVLGESAGVDPATVRDAIKDGAARCWVLDMRANKVMKRQFDPGFKARHHLKDLGFVNEIAKSNGLKLKGAEWAFEMFNTLVQEKGRGDWDNSAVMTVIEDMNNTTIKTDLQVS